VGERDAPSPEHFEKNYVFDYQQQLMFARRATALTPGLAIALTKN